MGRHLTRRVLVYALGGGHGHAVRGSTLVAALRETGAEATVLVRSSKVPRALGVPFLECPKPSSPEALRSFVLDVCRAHQVDTLVLDTFPEGLLGELRGGWDGPRRVSLLRCRRDGHSEAFRRAVESVDAAADLEPHLHWRPPSVATDALGPLTRFGATAKSHPSPYDVVLVASDAELTGFLGRLGDRLEAQGLRLGRVFGGVLRGASGTYDAFPLPAWALAARVVVGPAGFNLTYEAQFFGSWHVALPRLRSHDDQRRRAEVVARTVHSPKAAERLCMQLSSGAGPAPRHARIHSALEVAQWVLG